MKVSAWQVRASPNHRQWYSLKASSPFSPPVAVIAARFFSTARCTLGVGVGGRASYYGRPVGSLGVGYISPPNLRLAIQFLPGQLPDPTT